VVSSKVGNHPTWTWTSRSISSVRYVRSRAWVIPGRKRSTNKQALLPTCTCIRPQHRQELKVSLLQTRRCFTTSSRGAAQAFAVADATTQRLCVWFEGWDQTTPSQFWWCLFQREDDLNPPRSILFDPGRKHSSKIEWTQPFHYWHTNWIGRSKLLLGIEKSDYPVYQNWVDPTIPLLTHESNREPKAPAQNRKTGLFYMANWIVREGFVTKRSIGGFSVKREYTNTHTKHTKIWLK
jgi:hypothetical protein